MSLQLFQMAADYVNSCASSSAECHIADDKPSASDGSGCSAGNRSGCDVYVWGSNSSHQLAEGTQEKLTSPKQASAFLDIIEVGLFRLKLAYLLQRCYQSITGSGMVTARLSFS